MSLNKGSLDKANQDQKLDIEYLYRTFVAGEGIAAGQVVRLSTVADDTVHIAEQANSRLVCGVALETKLLGEQIKICIYGIVTVTAGANIARGDHLTIHTTNGTVQALNAFSTSVGSAHTHGSSLTMGVPSATRANCIYGVGIAADFCADDSGGDTTKAFSSIQTETLTTLPTGDHNHTIGGAIDDESAHTHTQFIGRYIGKALEAFTTGNSGLILICLF